MSNFSTNLKPTRRSSLGASLVLGLVIAGSLAAPALARDGDWDRHAAVAHHRWHRHYEPGPTYVNAPPVVYEAPPVQESSGINLILPLHIR